MIIPLSLREDRTLHHCHICNANVALCGAEIKDVDLTLLGKAFINVNLCLDCWKIAAVEYTKMIDEIETLTNFGM